MTEDTPIPHVIPEGPGKLRTSSVNDYKFLLALKPFLEKVRDSIGSTKVITVHKDSVDQHDEYFHRESFGPVPVPIPLRGSGSDGDRHLEMVMPVGKLAQLRPIRRLSSEEEESTRVVRHQAKRGSMRSFVTNMSVRSEYSFVKDTANGASATIFKSYLDGSFDSVAVKRIRGRIFKDHEEELQLMLDREKQALEELSSCPYITKFYEYFEYKPLDEHWMVMEFCDGGSAIELLRSKLPLKQIAAIVGAVLRAIEFIHSKGYIHGDIKCANILLSSPGVVKVCDFGLASKVRNVKNPDLHALGTVDYMAPEVMLRSLAIDEDDPYFDNFLYDRKIDIWAVGIVVLELLIGHPPLHGYKRANEDAFSYYIAKFPELEIRNTGLFELFFPPDEVINFISEYARSQGHRPPTKDYQKLVGRFPELQGPLRNNKLQELIHKMSAFETMPKPALDKKLFQFNQRSLLGMQQAQKMYSFNKCMSFVTQCLLIDPKWRPEAKEIGMHPFVRNQYKEYIRLEPEIENIIAQNRSRAGRKNLWKDYSAGGTVHEVHKIIKMKQDKLKESFISRKK